MAIAMPAALPVARLGFSIRSGPLAGAHDDGVKTTRSSGDDGIYVAVRESTRHTSTLSDLVARTMVGGV